MVKVSCTVCGKHEADAGVKLFTCSQCKSVPYCSRACQKADWKAGHKTACGFLNAGDAQQVVHSDHNKTTLKMEQMRAMAMDDGGDPDFRRIWDLFFKSQQETNHDATVKKMKKCFLRLSKFNKQVLLFRSLSILSQAPTEMLDLPTSPLKIALQCRVDPSVMSSPGLGVSDGSGSTPLHWVAEMSDPKDELVNTNQCIMARQLLEAGANPNARAERHLDRVTPLHRACHSAISTNLDLIKLLLDHGADPNWQNSLGETPLHHTMGAAPGAAKFLLTYSEKTDPNIVISSGEAPAFGHSFLAMVRGSIEETAMIDNTGGGILYGQLRELEALLVERGAVDVRP